jgi:uncharacterized protein (UPF0261 family)
MKKKPAIAVVGTFDSKGEEHLFLKECIERRGIPTLTVNVGTKKPSAFPANIDLYPKVKRSLKENSRDRDKAIETAIAHARKVILDRYRKGEIAGMITAVSATTMDVGTLTSCWNLTR